MKDSKAIGNFGEEICAEYLRENNCRILKRNFYSRFGEIDLIGIDTFTDELVFWEVKNFKRNSFLQPEEAITLKKRQRLLKTAQIFLQQNNFTDRQIRFDLVVVENGEIKSHYKNIFWAT